MWHVLDEAGGSEDDRNDRRGAGPCQEDRARGGEKEGEGEEDLEDEGRALGGRGGKKVLPSLDEEEGGAKDEAENGLCGVQ